jgi:putative heme degradation protein
MQPLRVQVVAYAPTVFRHCQHCEVAFAGVGLAERMHRNEARDALPDDLIADFQRVSDWVHELLNRHGPKVAVTVIDAASIEGFWTALRRGVRRFPAVIVDGQAARGAGLEAAANEIETRLGNVPSAAAVGRKEVPKGISHTTVD